MWQTTLISFIIIFCLCFHIVTMDNFTTKYLRAPSEGPKHQPRFLTFNTEEDGDVTVDLEFAIPFLTIPVKKTMNNAWDVYEKGFANMNLGGIILAGVVVFSTVVFFPLVTSLFIKHGMTMMKPMETMETSQRTGNDSSETWRILTLIDQALLENNIDTTSCMQRTICWLAKNARNKLNTGEANSQDKIIDGLMTNDWINEWIKGTSVQAAIHVGLENNNCSVYFSNCKITRKLLQTFTNKIVRFLQQGK